MIGAEEVKIDQTPIRRRIDTMRAWSAIQAHMKRHDAEMDRYAGMTQAMARLLADAVALLKQTGTHEEQIGHLRRRVENLEHLNEIRRD